MRIRVELQLTLAEGSRGGPAALAVEDGATVASVLGRLGLDYAEVGLVVRNGRSLEAGDILQEGDVLMVFPPLSGG